MRNKPKEVSAAILVEQNRPLIIDKICLPEVLLAGQILVKIEASGICGSQIGEITGAKGMDHYLPHLLGHEGCGKVLDIGEGVSTVQIGDKVVLHWRKGEGIEAKPPKYIWNDKQLNAGWVTTFNTHAVISENRCTRIPHNIDSELAALFGCAITTGFGVVENNAKLKMGESVIIYGAGGVGLNIIQACSLNSAYPIVAIDIFDNRLAIASELGATHIFNSNNCDVKIALKEITKDGKFDVVIDNTGLSKIIEEGYQILNSNGKLVLVGVPKVEDNINIFTLPLHFGKVIVGSYGGEAMPHKDIPRLVTLYEKNIANYKKIITSRVSLENINDAINMMRTGKTAGRVMVNMT